MIVSLACAGEDQAFAELIRRCQNCARRIFAQGVTLGFAFICCALASPYLIRGSVLLSGELNALFGTAAGFMHTPFGIGGAALCVLLLFIFKRRWVATIL